jgi:two-component system NtrC family sensor kinase
VEAKLAALYDLGQQLILLRDPQEIAEAVLEIAVRVLRLQDSDFLLVDETHEELYVVARRGLVQNIDGLRLPLDGPKGITVAAAQCGQPIYVPDVQKDPRYVYAGFPAVSELAVPVQIKDRLLGVLNVESAAPDAFSQADQELLCILANQAALALENACLYADERRRTEEMTILNVLTRRVSASLDLQATLEAIAAAAAELIPCALSEISLWDEKTQLLTLRALKAEPRRAWPLGTSYPPGHGYTGWLVEHKKPLLVPDVEARQGIRPHLLSGELPYAAYAGVPLLIGQEFIGILVLVANETGAFNELHIELLEALAAQAAVAIRNARLYEQVARRNEELSALYAVAEAVNRPFNLPDLLEHSLARVIEVTHAQGGGLRVLDPTSGQVVLAAHQGLSEAYIQAAGSFPISQEIVGWVARTGQPTLSEDMWTDSRVSPEIRDLLKEVGHRSLAQVPLRVQDRVVGTLGIVATAPGFFKEDDLKLLSAIGHEIGVAVENAHLYTDLAQRAKELEAVHVVAAAVNQPGDLDQILEQGLEQVLSVTGLEMGVIALRDPQDNTLALQGQWGMPPDVLAWLQRQLKAKSHEAWPEGQGVVVEEIPLQSSHIPAEMQAEGIRLTVEVPLLVEGDLVGLLIIATRQARPFTPEERSLLEAIGHQLGTAIANARLRQEALMAERLAAVGRVATSVAHDLRSPLGGILRSAEFLARPELSADTRRRLSQAVISLARRLISTTQEILEYVRGEEIPLKRVPCSLAEFLDEVLAVLEVDFSDQGIEVVRDCGYTGEVVMDADHMAQVVYNLAANARDAMPQGGTFTVSTCECDGQVELSFSDTGPGVPEALSDQIFEPFFTYGKREGAGLGLSIAKRIVKEHGGELRVENRDPQGATFVVSLPL